jgi:hypothetical protein
MDNPTPTTHTKEGFAFTIISMICAIISRITMEDAKAWISVIAGVMAIISAGMAIRYYHFATKKVRQ